jgi:hypothetical protein
MADLLPHQQRVVEERALQEFNVSKLRELIAGETFRGLDRNERRLLINQEAVMTEFIGILGERIAGFEAAGFTLGAPADLSGDGTCEACQ